MIPWFPASSEARHRQRWRLGILAGATLIGLAEASKAYAAYYFGGEPVSVGFVLIENLPWWYLWAAFIPVVVWLVRRAPIDQAPWWRSMAVHLPASVLVAVSHLFLYSLFHYPAIARGGADPTFLAQEQRFFASFIFYEVLTYWSILLGYYVVIYYRRYRVSAVEAAQAEARAARLEVGRVEASLNALRMELNPHFLFNALNAVSGLIRNGESEAAVHMLARLGELLRTTLEQRHDLTVTLADELAFLQQYLAIEQIRFRDRLSVVMDVEDDCRDAMVPPLILQPLVENAIRHGVARLPGPGRVRIVARRDGEDLVLDIEDSGPGLGQRRAPVREGVGLSNTRSRLRELYRDEGSVGFVPVDRGAIVRVRLPLTRVGAADAWPVGA
jgi:signal transduction histidine kinase